LIQKILLYFVYSDITLYITVLNEWLVMNRIKSVLKEKGIKQTTLSEKLGKSYNMVNGYVQNRQQPRLEVLNEIAHIIDVDVRELLVSNKQEK
jgi:putative transcriptional regulator